MPARDRYHDTVRHALEHDGWQITHDPYSIPVGRKHVFVDLGAEKLIAAEKSGQRIAVEVKTFGGPSDVHDFEEALGQYFLYEPLLKRHEPGRQLYLAISDDVYAAIFEDEIGQIILEEYDLKLILFDAEQEVVTRWIPSN